MRQRSPAQSRGSPALVHQVGLELDRCSVSVHIVQISFKMPMDYLTAHCSALGAPLKTLCEPSVYPLRVPLCTPLNTLCESSEQILTNRLCSARIPLKGRSSLDERGHAPLSFGRKVNHGQMQVMWGGWMAVFHWQRSPAGSSPVQPVSGYNH